eukprot:13253155-Alexandrium_andersonii.AAC.1
MSASLVGSEMCIRDSVSPNTSWYINRRPAPCTRARTDCDRSARHGDTVSYTHLTLPTICSV